jgi:hypothetical protein
VKCGLSAFKAPNDQDLLYGPKWPQQRIDQWLREVLPLLFEFLDRRYPENAAPAYHWVLVRKSRQTQYVLQRTTITGEELEEAKGSNARKWQDHSIRIGEFYLIDRSQPVLTASKRLSIKFPLPWCGLASTMPLRG